MFEAIGNAKIGQNFDTTVTMPKIDPIVYKANISDLGVLGHPPPPTLFIFTS